MTLVFTITHHSALRLAEVAFLLILIAGVWLVFAELWDPARWGKFRTIVAGICLAVAGLLLIVATHWGNFG
jgi:hypothetical protein